MIRKLLVVVALFALQACSNYSADRYSISVDNVEALREILEVSPGLRIGVGPFTAAEPGLKSINCRLAGPVQAPDGLTFADYIRKAIVDELRLAKVYGRSGDLTISGHLVDVTFDSVEGLWTLVLTVSGDEGTQFTVSEVYDFDTSFVAVDACDGGADALMPAVQNLIRSIFNHPEFREMIASAPIQ